MNKVGDAISSLQVDQYGNKPSHVEAVYNLLDKLNPKELNGAAQQMHSVAGAPAASPSNAAPTPGGKIRMLKFAGVIAAVFVVMTLPAVQSIFEKFSKSTAMKLLIQAAIVFIFAVVLLKKYTA